VNEGHWPGWHRTGLQAAAGQALSDTRPWEVEAPGLMGQKDLCRANYHEEMSLTQYTMVVPACLEGHLLGAREFRWSWAAQRSALSEFLGLTDPSQGALGPPSLQMAAVLARPASLRVLKNLLSGGTRP
jgi:hypothetical protein